MKFDRYLQRRTLELKRSVYLSSNEELLTSTSGSQSIANKELLGLALATLYYDHLRQMLNPQNYHP